MQTQTVYLGARVAFGFSWALLTTLSLVYMVETVGLNPLQMVLVGTVLEATILLFEVPTGMLADLVSRRLSVIIGHVLMGLGWLLTAAVPEFSALLLAQVLWGLGWTFISGAYPAWLSGEIGAECASALMLKAAQWGHLAGFVGIGAAVVLGAVSLALPLWVGGGGLLAMALWLSVAMREEHYLPESRGAQPLLAGLVQTAQRGWQIVRSDRLLLLLLLVAAFYGASGEGLDRLFAPLVIARFVLPDWPWVGDLGWWGVIAAVGNLVGFLAGREVRRRVRLHDESLLRAQLAMLLVAVALCVVLLASSHSLIVVLLLFWTIGGLRSAYGPTVTAWLNQRLPERGKATALSLFGQADACGQVLFGPQMSRPKAWRRCEGMLGQDSGNCTSHGLIETSGP